MDNIEEKFYKTFEIEKRCIRPKDCIRKGICRGAVACDFYTYPEITYRILLELICIVADIHNYNGDVFDIGQNNINELKKFILHFLIDYTQTKHTNIFYQNDEVKANIQQLFKGASKDETF